MEAFFENSTVLTFAVSKEQLADLIPERLVLDTYLDRWAFVAVAMVQTRNLRPKGFPEFAGLDFFLIGYRIFVRYINKAGKSLRGLYILKSETDKKKMELMGKIFTRYNYSTTDISVHTNGNLKTISSVRSKFRVVIEKTESDAEIPPGSPFTDWKDAKKFAGPLPNTFSYDAEKQTVLIIEGVRQNWKPKPLKVISCSFEFINALNLHNPVLANAFEIENVPYYWKKGRLEKWN